MIALVALLASMAGVWGADVRFPQISGTLTIDARSTEWSALIDGADVPVQHRDQFVTFAIPGDRGRFRGAIDTNGTIRGTWFQPATVLSGARYASPLTLVRGRGPSRVWRGTVRPLIDRVTWYLVVASRPDGTLRAFLRDPGRNAGMGRPFAVSIDGTSIVVRNVDDPRDELRGTIDNAHDRFVLDVPDVGPMAFTRRAAEHAPGFTPFGAGSARWTYRSPLPSSDGWRVGTLTESGIAQAPIAALARRIIATRATSPRTPAIQALLIARHGRLVLEEYFDGFDAHRPHDLRSAGKTFTGLLTGIALDRHPAFSLATSVVSLFPNDRGLANNDARKQRITVANLLTMTSGLACDDDDDRSPGNEDRMYAQTWQPDYYRFTLDLPMARAPGAHTAVYCTAAINLLGGVVRHTTGLSVIDAFDQFIARPLEFSEYHLNLTPTGDAYAGGGLFLRARDALKLGQVALDGGTWNGQRLVSASWMRASTTTHSVFLKTPFTEAHGYGYTWHVFAPRVGGRTYREYMAQGNGGQLIVVLPDFDATMLIFAANYNNFPTWRAFYEQLIPQYIIRAMRPARNAFSVGS